MIHNKCFEEDIDNQIIVIVVVVVLLMNNSQRRQKMASYFRGEVYPVNVLEQQIYQMQQMSAQNLSNTE